MFQAAYAAYDRVRRPLRNHHYMAFPAAGIAFARIPGMPYEAARPLLAAISGDIVPSECETDHQGWLASTELLTARELTRRYPDIFIFAFVQNPAERIASSYQNLMASKRDLPTFYRDHQFVSGMSLEDFTSRLLAIGDFRADNLFRGQAAMLTYKGRLMPDMSIRLDRLKAEWPTLAEAIKQRAKVDIGQHPPVSYRVPEMTAQINRDSSLISQLKRRYKKDYRAFFEPAGNSPAPVPSSMFASGKS